MYIKNVLILFKVFSHIFATFSFKGDGCKKFLNQQKNFKVLSAFLLTYFTLGTIQHYSILKKEYTHLDFRILVHGFKE